MTIRQTGSHIHAYRNEPISSYILSSRYSSTIWTLKAIDSNFIKQIVGAAQIIVLDFMKVNCPCHNVDNLSAYNLSWSGDSSQVVLHWPFLVKYKVGSPKWNYLIIVTIEMLNGHLMIPTTKYIWVLLCIRGLDHLCSQLIVWLIFYITDIITVYICDPDYKKAFPIWHVFGNL